MDENNTQENQYCKRCGNVIDKDADFCPACGEQTRKSEITYV
ncbi:MAG: zinc ribbon domain-containing protein, partial [Candidatus Bathyarchaeota archaeon]